MLVIAAIGLVLLALAVGVPRALGYRRGARTFCPRCGANHPKLIDVISDGGVWLCRGCKHEWDLVRRDPKR